MSNCFNSTKRCNTEEIVFLLWCCWRRLLVKLSNRISFCFSRTRQWKYHF